MSPELQGSLITLLSLASAALFVLLGRALLDLSRAARAVGRSAEELRTLVPRAERTLERSEEVMVRLERTASHVESMGARARAEIEDLAQDLADLRDGGRKVSAVIHGARAGIEALKVAQRANGHRH